MQCLLDFEDASYHRVALRFGKHLSHDDVPIDFEVQPLPRRERRAGDGGLGLLSRVLRGCRGLVVKLSVRGGGNVALIPLECRYLGGGCSV